MSTVAFHIVLLCAALHVSLSLSLSLFHPLLSSTRTLLLLTSLSVSTSIAGPAQGQWCL